MSIELGTKTSEVELERPNTFQPSLRPKGAKHELQGGGMEFDLMAYKWMWRVSWRMLTATQKNIIVTQAQKTSLSLIDFADTQFDVEMTEPLVIEYTEGTDPIRYHVSLLLEER